MTKFDRNRERDQHNIVELHALGWRVAVVWECGLREGAVTKTLSALTAWLPGSSVFIELPDKSSAGEEFAGNA
jgi:DNA mismatch endonuclease (patch repair protein)